MEQEMYNCETCGDIFDSEQKLQRHIRLEHDANGHDIDQVSDEDDEVAA